MIYLDYTEDRIKRSAKKVFYEKGLNGARVAEIAKEAEVSKSLLHYYFRTKEQIFRIVIKDSINLVVNRMVPILTQKLGFYELIDQFINNIFILFRDNKKLMLFIITEYNQNFEKIEFALKPILVFFKEFEYKIQIQSKKENVIIKYYNHLITNIISLCGWHIIGINLLSLDNHINKDIDSSTITKIRESIYKNIATLVEKH